MPSPRRSDQRYAAEAQHEIDDIFTLLDRKQLRVKTHGEKLPLQQFFPATWLGFEELPQDPGLLFAPSALRDLWPVHVKQFVDGSPNNDGLPTFNALDTVSAKEVRGKVRHTFPRMLRLAQGVLDGRQLHVITSYFGVTDENSLVDLKHRERIKPDQYKRAVLLASLQLNLEYEWTVEIKRTGHPATLRIMTSPEGARRLLSLRDVEPGQQRRRALRHWVSEHTRRLPTGDGGERDTTVSQHLRGATPFQWDDYEGIVRSAPYDLRRA